MEHPRFTYTPPPSSGLFGCTYTAYTCSYQEERSPGYSLFTALLSPHRRACSPAICIRFPSSSRRYEEKTLSRRRTVSRDGTRSTRRRGMRATKQRAAPVLMEPESVLLQTQGRGFLRTQRRPPLCPRQCGDEGHHRGSGACHFKSD